MPDGTPYAPYRFKQIVMECYRISHRINTSYTDLYNITPLERKYILNLIELEDKKQKEELEKLRLKSEERKSSR